MVADAIAGAIFLVMGILLVLAPRHMLRVNAYIMLVGGASKDQKPTRNGLLLTRAFGVVFLLVGASIFL